MTPADNTVWNITIDRPFEDTTLSKRKTCCWVSICWCTLGDHYSIKIGLSPK